MQQFRGELSISASTASKRRPGASESNPSGMRHRKEVAVDEAAARVLGQLLAEQQQALLVPFDHLRKRIDHHERSRGWIFEHRLRDNDDIEVRCSDHQGRARPSERDENPVPRNARSYASRPDCDTIPAARGGGFAAPSHRTHRRALAKAGT